VSEPGNPMALFDRIGGEYLAGHEVSMTLMDPGLRIEPPEPRAMGISGYVNALRSGLDLAAPTVVRPLRAWLLDRAEDMITAFAAEGWVLDDAPRFEFFGSLQHARLQTPTPPQEYGIGLRVDLSLVHFDLEPAS
jgi:hypothetical protein